jgi:hypothetical protein
MVGSIGDLLKLGSAALKESFEAWFAVLSAPRQFIASLDLASKETLTKASVFAVFISIVNLMIEGPLLRSLGVQIETPAFLLFDTVFTYAGFFLIAVLYHLAATIVRGRGTLLASVIAFLYLTAWKPIGALVSAPLGIHTTSLWLKHPVNREFGDEFARTLLQQPDLFFNLAIYGVYVACFVIWGARMFGVVHDLKPLRATALSVLGYLFGAVAVVVLLGPVQRAALLAFRVG